MFETKRLHEVADFCNDRRQVVRGQQRLLRRGPFPLYVENGIVPFDDYSYDGLFLILGSLCNVETSQGCFAVQQAEGKFSVTDLYHVIAGKTDADTRYLREVLSHMPVRGRADEGGQSIRLAENSLRYLPIPWPAKAERQAFVALGEEHRDHLQNLGERLTQLAEGNQHEWDEALRASVKPATYTIDQLCTITLGRSLDAHDRTLGGRYPVVSSQGLWGHTNVEGIDGPCLVIGQAGQFLVGGYYEEGAFPLGDAIALAMRKEAPLSALALSVVLAQQGIRPRLRFVDNQAQALALPLDQLGSMTIAVPDATLLASLEQRLSQAFEASRALEAEKEAGEHTFNEIVSRFLAQDSSVLNELAVKDSLDSATSQEEDVASAEVSQDLSSTTADELASRAVSLVDQALALLSTAEPEATLFDATWEVIPLIAARSLATQQQWESLLQAPSPADCADQLIREAASRTTHWQPAIQLLGESSTLAPQDRSALLQSMVCWNSSSECGQLVRLLAGTARPDTLSPREATKHAPRESKSILIPESVANLMASLALLFYPNAVTAFDPFSQTGAMLNALGQAVPSLSRYGETPLFSDALADVLAWLSADDAPSEIAVGESLCNDVFEGRAFDIVASILPCNAGEWSEARPSDSDPRWQFGTPPRNKANLAWLQHAYSHRADEGIAVLAVANATLHESRGCEPSVRRALIDSGCAQVVIALPGKIFEDERPPMSIVVLGSERADDCETLFINLLESGVEFTGFEGFSGASRFLPPAVAEQVIGLVTAWHAGKRDGFPSFAKSVSKSQIKERGLLTPWTYTAR